MTALNERLQKAITEVKDFPKPGINYKDITTLFMEPELCKDLLKAMADKYKSQGIEGVVALESRGFLFGFPLALELGVPFIMMRKKGKLPRETFAVSYSLEYGEAIIEVHKDSIREGQNILVHDDVLATGGTAAAAAELVKMSGGKVAGFSFLVELEALNGRDKLNQFSRDIFTFAAY